jgi:hypothetical protein
MPLYPLGAVLVGVMIDRCSQARVGTYPRRAWHQFLLLWCAVIGVAGLVVGASGVFASFYQPPWFAITFALLACGAAFLLWRTYWHAERSRPILAVLAIVAVAGVGASGLMMNVNVARWNDPTGAVAQLREQLPGGTKLVSFSPIEHRFAYYFARPIEELDWPLKTADLPPDVDYFCFMRQPGDSATSRAAGRGRTWYTTPGTLPFDWEEVASICVERRVYDDNPRTVVLGRVVRPVRPVITDVTAPQSRRVGAAHRAIQRK